MTDMAYDYTEARWDAERAAAREGKPQTRMDEALERGYVPGDDS